MEVGKVFQLFQLIKGKKQVLQPILTGHSGLFIIYLLNIAKQYFGF